MSEPSAGMMVTSNVRLIRPLGEGGMGSVWVAEHASLRTNVVVKFMSGNVADSDEGTARFSREAAAASQVKSPHVVQTFDHGVTDDGRPYIVMELLEGEDLEQQIRRRGVLPSDEVVAIAAQLARALTKAHEIGIVHRDIKPSNVFLLDAGSGELFVKLLDFGIAKGPEVGIVGSTTRTGAFIGSPFYMSPEQVIGDRNIGCKSDLWSLGVVAYEALTGAKPFFAETVGALALKIHRDPLPVPSHANPLLPSAVDDWFVKACARDPEERFASAKEMVEALAIAATGEAIPPGLRVNSSRAPRSMASSAPPAEAENVTVLAGGNRLDTALGVGVGIAPRTSPAQQKRSRWGSMATAGIVAASAVAVLIVKSTTRPAEALGPTSSATMVSAALVPVTVRPPVENRPAETLPPSTPPVPPSANSAALPSLAPVHSRPVVPRPVHSSPVISAAPSATAATKRLPGDDDDIK